MSIKATNLTDENSSVELPPTSFYDLIGQFNIIFHDKAKAIIDNNRLSITIGNRTMHIRLPMVSGAESTGVSEEF